ncbi:Sugar kinase of the NBD/HSP70 family, may contain an N-terminal HTH domain [Puniceibacterium sediminis]|uniref:Sugar kinase of the NBD/HSP70 family, may contain an N-terminal HTH domain n=1 Tax=Puniceibacterium sediminis TaxID=1608407 RepID=A0A238VUJ0_9RHOB|nr:Sugar kinase of the NBD/HSP70 family, may contain an N-terminal HTH domain [Puniceibacterium sediminis]
MERIATADRGDGLAEPGSRGSNQSGMRAHNERLVLTLVRRHGALAKAEIARTTGLSAQTVSVIMRQLEADGLLVKGDPVRGKVGQPSVPMRLAAEGAYFLGIKIGRRNEELVLIDFLGKVHGRVQRTHAYPHPEDTVSFALQALRELTDPLSAEQKARIAGLGIAMPFEMWNWARLIGVDPAEMATWQDRDIKAELAAQVPYPVYLQNDASCACGAELVLGAQDTPRDFLYFYVGYFIGGGLVLNGTLYSGRSGNAGALGSMPVPGPGGSLQLIDVASLSGIEKLMEQEGLPTQGLWGDPENWSVPPGIMDIWIADAAKGIAHAIAASASLIDFESVLIDGWIPAAVRDRLVQDVRTALARINMAGITPPEVNAGTVGPSARSLGAACLPLSERFLVDGQAFLKQG